MGWRGTLALEYRRRGDQTVVHDRHNGPLRVLRSLHPEGPRICHSVLVHPPGGIVGGDVLQVEATLGAGAHALLTTPGATRFYRSAGEPAEQSVDVRAEAGSRLEWLPLETIAYSGCLATSRLRFDLRPGAEMMGWDVVALGLPASDLPFDAGTFTQAIELPGRWIERGVVGAADRRLLDSPLGGAGQRALGVLWFAAADTLEPGRRDALLAAARAAAKDHVLAASSGATSPQASVVVLRTLAPGVEPAMDLLSRVWSAWRRLAWDLEAPFPRVWRT